MGRTQNSRYGKRNTDTDRKMKVHPVYIILLAVVFGMVVCLCFAMEVMSHDPMCGKYEDNRIGQIVCTNVTMSKEFERNGVVDFTVEFENPYGENAGVTKFPSFENERIMVRGGKVIWEGTHSSLEKKRLPKTMISFHSKRRAFDDKCKHKFDVKCPQLGMIEEKIETVPKSAKRNRRLDEVYYIFGFIIVLFLLGYTTGSVMNLFVER